MARSRSRAKIDTYRPARRDLTTYTPITKRPSRLPRPIPVLREIEDRRTFHPDPIRDARSFDTPYHRLVVSKPLRPSSYVNPFSRSSSLSPRAVSPRAFRSPVLSPSVAFHAPEKVLICVRRAVRKEVMFAKKFAGGRGGRQRRPKYNWFSSVSCKR